MVCARSIKNHRIYSGAKFSPSPSKGERAFKGSGNEITNHFACVSKMVSLGSGAERKIEDVMLSRYACYFMIQNTDFKKEIDEVIGHSYKVREYWVGTV